MAKIHGQLERAQLENIDNASEPSPGTRGRLWWDNDLGRARIDNGTSVEDLGGGGSAGINYVDNPDAEGSTDGWATYQDAAASTPVDGTGGTAASTWTRTTSTPLRGDASFLLSKSAADRQGEGVSYDFAIDKADEGRSLSISFDFEGDSGFVSGDNSDVRIFVYDIDNANLITPQTSPLLTGNGTYESRFDATDSTNYRLILHIATTSATAYTLKVDNVQIGPQETVQAVPASDWVTFTPTGNFVTNTTYDGRWRRVGDTMELQIRMSTSGTVGSPGNLEIDMPAGYTIDTAKIPAGSRRQCGVALAEDAGSTTWDINVASTATNKFQFWVGNGSVPDPSVDENSPFLWDVGDTMLAQIAVPVVGWTSNVVLQNASTFRMANILPSGTNVTATPAALGEYRTYIKDAAAETATDDAPATAPSAANGMLLYGNVNFASAGTAGQTGRWEIYVGLNKIVKFEFYKNSNRTNMVSPDYHVDGVNARGVITGYSPSTGVAFIDGINQESTTTSRSVGIEIPPGGGAPNNLGSIFFDVVVSEKVIPVQVDQRGTTKTATISSSGLVAPIAANITDEKGDWISTATYSATGVIDIVVNTGIFDDLANADIQVETKRGAAIGSIRIQQVSATATTITVESINHSTSAAADDILMVKVTEIN